MRFKKRAVSFVLSLASLVGCEFALQKKAEIDCTNSVKKTELYSPEDYIRSDCYKSLLIEIDCVEGIAPPNKEVLRGLERVLKQVMDKPAGFSYVVDDLSLLKEKDVYNLDDLYLLSRKHRSFGVEKLPKNVLSLHVLYANGRYRISDDKTAVGIALDGGAIVVFKDRIRQQEELPLLVHEIGHVIGLKHDSNPACVMYHKITAVSSFLFDEDCLKKIYAVGKK